MNYITLYQVKQQLKLLTTTVDDSIFYNWIKWSCSLIDWWKGRRFDVFQATYRLDTPLYDVSPIGNYRAGEYNPVQRLFSNNRLYLNVASLDLLEVVELLNGDEEEIESSQYLLEPIQTAGKNRIVLKKGNNWKLDIDGNSEQAIALTGIFGYNQTYPNCFVPTGETITASGGFPTNQNTFSVEDYLGQAQDFLSPRIQIGNLLRLKSNLGTEFLLVIDIEADDYDQIVTVRRAFNGTTAYAHPQNTVIEVYRPDDTIIQMALRLTQWRYRQKDQDQFDKTYNLATQVVSNPTALPSDVRNILGRRREDLSL